MSRVVGQISNNKVSIFLRGYLVDLRRVFQEFRIAYFGSASGQQWYLVEKAGECTAQRS